MVRAELFERMVAILVSLASRTVMPGMTVVLTGGTPLFAPNALWVFVGLGVLQCVNRSLSYRLPSNQRHS
jgi:hypothetical protein